MPDISFELNGATVVVVGEGSLLDVLRDELGDRSVKDGCSPQGQCGCCTVWVDGQPRVACVTPVSRVAGRAVTTVEGLADADAWASQLTAHGASQCGFCTPGITMRLAALPDRRRADETQVRKAMLGHLCRCTGWQPIIETAVGFEPGLRVPDRSTAAAQRAEIEGRVPQRVGSAVALGRGGFAADSAPDDALVGLRGADGEWVLAETLSEARRRSEKVQGRRTTAPLERPVPVPAGDWVRTLQTTWVEPAYLEPDATWCEPGGIAASTVGNGGAFGGKGTGALEAEARRLADRHGRAVRLLSTREDVVRLGPKRPPLAAGIDADGRGMVSIVRTQGAQTLNLPVGFELAEVDAIGPPTSLALRGAVLTELLALRASLQSGPEYTVTTENGATATASATRERIEVAVECGEILDPIVLRSYCIGAAHMALGLVTSEGLAIGDDGAPLDLTMRSFGVVRAVDTPEVVVTLRESTSTPVNGSDAVFAAVAAAVWSTRGFAPQWPTDA